MNITHQPEEILAMKKQLLLLSALGMASMASEVPWASFWLNPSRRTRAGTMMIPPPIPTILDIKPAARPIARIIKMAVNDIFLISFDCSTIVHLLLYKLTN